MTIKISVEGANVQEVLAQMLSLMNVPAPPANVPKTANGVDKASPAAQATPAPTGKRPVGRPPKNVVATTTDDPPSPVPTGEQISPPEEPDPSTPAEDAKPEKSAADIRHDAVAVLRNVYKKGPAGQAKVDEICKHFNVVKLVDVPLERAVELLQLSNRALFALEN